MCVGRVLGCTMGEDLHDQSESHIATSPRLLSSTSCARWKKFSTYFTVAIRGFCLLTSPLPTASTTTTKKNNNPSIPNQVHEETALSFRPGTPSSIKKNGRLLRE